MSRPIDLVHLARQTMGDRGLEREVLALFLTQLSSAREALADADAPGRARIAHGLKGSARGVGAFGLATSADGLEQAPDRDDLLRMLCDAMDEADEFISGISD